MLPERVGYIIWVSDAKSARGLEKYGSVHYISPKLRYAVMYFNAERADTTIRTIQRLPYVKRIERSYRTEIRTEYTKTKDDKSRFFDVM